MTFYTDVIGFNMFISSQLDDWKTYRNKFMQRLAERKKAVALNEVRNAVIEFRNLTDANEEHTGEGLQVFKDYTNTDNPKDRHWAERKALSVLLADRYLTIWVDNRLFRGGVYTDDQVYDGIDITAGIKRSTIRGVLNCGAFLEFAVMADGSHRLIKASFCKDRFCPMCQWRRSIKLSYQTKEVLMEALNQEPNARFLFLTLTVKNCDGDEIKQTIKRLNMGFKNLVRYKRVSKNLIGAVKSIEVTVNRSTNEYHPHIHAIIMVKSTYFKNSDHYLNQQEWSTLWKKAAKLDYMPIVNIERIKGKGNAKDAYQASIQEVSKYQVKTTEYLSDDAPQDLKIIRTLRTQLNHTRMFSFYGLLQDINKALFKDKDIDDDLVNVTDKSDNEIVVSRMLTMFSHKFKDYRIISNNPLKPDDPLYTSKKDGMSDEQ